MDRLVGRRWGRRRVEERDGVGRDRTRRAAVRGQWPGSTRAPPFTHCHIPFPARAQLVDAGGVRVPPDLGLVVERGVVGLGPQPRAERDLAELRGSRGSWAP